MDFHTILDLPLLNPANSCTASYVYKFVALNRSFVRGGATGLSNIALRTTERVIIECVSLQRARSCHQ
uniref:Uncharacterized protein n=1 Tax=Wuchereria bancrofti TaxID=6293 RepID=A0AAF5PGZ3_WUCBA